MKKTLFGIFSVLPLLCAQAEDLRPMPLEISAENSQHLNMKDLGNGEWELELVGTPPLDPYFFVQSKEPIPFETHNVLSFESFSGTEIGKAVLYVGNWDMEHVVEYPNVARSEGWMNTSIDLSGVLRPPSKPFTKIRVTLGSGAEPGHKFKVRNFAIRKISEWEKNHADTHVAKARADREHAARIDTYLDEKFPAAVTKVSPGKNGKIRISGTLPEAAEGKAVFLAEIPMWTDPTMLNEESDIPALLPVSGNKFRKTVSRFADDKSDRIISGWAVVEKNGKGYKLLSPVKYVDEGEIESRADLPHPNPASLKGIGGMPFDHPDMQELQISSTAYNIVLNALIENYRHSDFTIPYEYGGHTFYISQSYLGQLDMDLKAIFDADQMLSVIILISNPKGSPEGSWLKTVGHPDALPSSIFVSPTLDTKEAVTAYAAAMSFLAERYSRPGGEFGRIHYWIMQNEINSAYFWSSAGDITVQTYMDIYQKSMRLAQIYARHFNPHAKTLISLDHNWGTCHHKGYRGREMLEYLVKYSQKEGDFEWGMALHPYARDLFNARIWDDPQAVHSFDTPYLTHRNLEVADAWAKLPQNAYNGKVMREIQLTEQGVNTRDYEKESLDDQAAGVAYLWKKIEPLDSITVYHYHLWADNPHEGGLLLGLRKLPTGDDPLGKKPAWEVFKHYGNDTPEWEQWSDFALKHMGFGSWDEIIIPFGQDLEKVTEGGRNDFEKLKNLYKK